MTVRCRLLSREELAKAEDDRLALAKSRGADPDWCKANKADYGWASLGEITGPCVMWLAPWYFNPENRAHKIRRDQALKAIANGSFGSGERNYYLSRFYWQDWSDKRPPICVLTPNGKEWCVDARSSNGEGWKVTGKPPSITCKPSIQVPGYHGWLTNGEFSAPL